MRSTREREREGKGVVIKSLLYLQFKVALHAVIVVVVVAVVAVIDVAAATPPSWMVQAYGGPTYAQLFGL